MPNYDINEFTEPDDGWRQPSPQIRKPTKKEVVYVLDDMSSGGLSTSYLGSKKKIRYLLAGEIRSLVAAADRSAMAGQAFALTSGDCIISLYDPARSKFQAAIDASRGKWVQLSYLNQEDGYRVAESDEELEAPDCKFDRFSDMLVALFGPRVVRDEKHPAFLQYLELRRKEVSK